MSSKDHIETSKKHILGGFDGAATNARYQPKQEIKKDNELSRDFKMRFYYDLIE